MRKHCKTLLMMSAVMMAGVCVLSACGGGTGVSPMDDDKTINVLYEGWINTNLPQDYENNPYKKYIDETFDVDYRLNTTSDFKTEIAKRYSSSSSVKPDMVVFNDLTQLRTLYNQGFYVQDYTQWLDELPAIKPYYETNKTKIASCYNNGKLITIALPVDTNYRSFKIRKDWVKEWSPTHDPKDVPETTNELLDMARWVKQNKGSNYYLFTSAGDNKNLGSIGYLQYMFGEYNDWYIDANGNINHPILDGSHEQFLNFMRTVYEEGLIDPNWYIQSWGNHKTKLFAGNIGMDHYPAVIAQEYLAGNNNNEETASDIWEFMPMPTSEPGVTRQDYTITHLSRYIAINKDTAKNTVKMKKLLKIINDTMFNPTQSVEDSSYYKLRWGLEVDNYTIGNGNTDEFTEVVDKNGNATGFYAYYVNKNRENHKKSSYGGLWDYGVMLENLGDKVIEYQYATTYGQSAYDFIEMYNDTQAHFAKQTKINYMDSLYLNDKLVNAAAAVADEFEINYIKKTNSQNYEKFKSSWLAAGGEQLKQMAVTQLKALGYEVK